MTRLRPALAIHCDETLTSYVSRLAQFHKRPGAHKFCVELGIDLRSLCHGSPESYERLHEITNIPVDIMRRAAVVRRTDGWTLRGERFKRTALRRTSVAFCPACLAEDAADRKNIGSVIYERLAWTLEAVRSCSRHQNALTIISPQAKIQDLRDFARQIILHRKSYPGAFERVRSRQATDLERYIENRLYIGESENTALNAIPLYAIIRACEVFGTADLYGPTRTPMSLNSEERTLAGNAGFASLSRGRCGISELMERVRSKKPSSASHRPSSVYGNLHTWLYHAKDPAYGTFKDSAAEYIIGHSASHLRGSLFGCRIIDRPWYTIWTASVAFDIDPGRLRNFMTAAGRISPDEASLSNDRIVIPAAELRVLLQDLRGCVGWNRLSYLLDVPRRTVAEFVGPGLIEPMIKKANHRLKSDLFRRSDVNDFMDRLLHHATLVETPSPGLFDFLSTRRRSLIRTKDLIVMLLQNGLTTVERWAGATGVSCIFLDPEEVRRVAYPQKLDGPTFKKASALLRIHPAAVNALVVNGYLESQCIGPQRERNATKIIPWTTIKKFRETYITQFELARLLAVSYPALDRILRDRHISTVQCAKQIGVKLYLRTEVAPIKNLFEKINF